MSKVEEIAIIDKNIRFYFVMFALLSPKNQTIISKICFFVYKLLLITVQYINMIFSIAGIFTCQNLVNRMILLGITGANLVSIVNFHIFQWKSSDLERILKGIVVCSKWKNYKKGFLTYDITKLLRKVRIITYIFFINLSVVINAKHLLYIFNGNVKKRLLPSCTWNPFEGEEFFKFAIFFAIQYVSSIVLAWTCISSFLLTIYGICFVAFELKSLAFDYNNCIFETLHQQGIPRRLVVRFRKCFVDNNVYHYIRGYDVSMRNIAIQLKKQRIDDELVRNLKKYIARHQSLVQLSNDLEGLLKPLQLVFIFSMIVVFIITTNHAFMVFEIQLIQIAVTTAVSILNCFAAGELLKTMNHKIEIAIYSTPWYLCSIRTQKLFFIILQLSQRTASIKIIWFNMDLQNFVKIFGNVYSLLATMRSMFLKYKQ